jgi:phage-related protein
VGASRTTCVSVLVVGLVLVAWLAPAGAATTSAKDWASGVCSAVQTFADSVDTALSSLKNADSVQSAAQGASDSLQKAATDLQSSLNDLGKPSSSDATQAKKAVQKLGTQLSNSVDAIRGLLTPAPQTAAEIASTFAEIGSEVTKAVDVAKSTANTLKGLKPNGALRKAFQRAPSCKQLKRSLSS